MNTLSFFQEFISPRCHKIEHDTIEFKAIKNSILVKATTLYQIYKHNVYETDGRLEIRDFYKIAGQYLYYDKYLCVHGTEYYYYIIFNEDNQMYQLTKDLITKRIESNSPSLLKDLIKITGAMQKEE